MDMDGKREGRVAAAEHENRDRTLGMDREIMEVDSGRQIKSDVRIHL